MARLSIKETKLKLKALNEAIKTLKKQSTPTKNLVIVDNILDIANSSTYSSTFTSNISRSSLLQPTSPQLKKIANKLKKFRKKHLQRKNVVSDKSKQIIVKLEKQLSSVTINVVELLDNEILLKESINLIHKSLDKVKNERDYYIIKLNEIKEKYEN